MKVRFTAAAVADLDLAAGCYDAAEPGLGGRFLDQLDAVVDRLEVFPNAATPVDAFPGVRRARMRRFAYGVFYRVNAGQVEVLSALHSRQDTIPRLDDR